MLKVRKNHVKHRGKITDNLTEFGVLATYIFYAIVLPEFGDDTEKARYRMESFMDDALKIAKKMRGKKDGE